VTPTVVVLARDPRRAKTRLRSALDPVKRERLVLGMFDDVVAAARSTRWPVLVVTDSPAIGARARVAGARALVVPARGTRDAARHGAERAARDGADAVLIVAADFCSPWFYTEPDLRGGRLRGTVLSSALFSDAAAAAVMTPAPGPAPGYRIIDTRSVCLPGTEDALGWDDRHHFILSDAPKLVPGVLPVIAGLLEDLGWTAASLDVATLHSGGNAIIKAVAKGLGLTDHQVAPAWHSLQHGNLMAAAVLHAMALAAADPALRPRPGGRGILAGFGPGFAMSAAAWEYHDPAAARP